MLFKKNKTEATVQAHFNKRAKDLKGCWHIKLSDRYHSHVPDNVIIYKGYTYWIELKAKDKKPEPGQEETGRKIVAAGGLWMWFSTKEGVDGFFDRLENGQPTNRSIYERRKAMRMLGVKPSTDDTEWQEEEKLSLEMDV